MGSFVLGTIVRVGRQPPNEYELSEYYADFMIMENLVEMLRSEPYLPNRVAQDVEKRLFQNAKIFISTLNHCGSFRMRCLVKKVGFLIIDEGKYKYLSTRKY